MPPVIRKCILCGREFEDPNGFVERCSNQHYATCEVCGKQFPVDCQPNQTPKTCSKECQNILTVRKRDKTVKQKYGVDNVNELDSVKRKIGPRTSFPSLGHPERVEKRCEWCGELFTPKSKTQKYCSRPHYMTCVVCGGKYQVKENTELSNPPRACSRQCAAILRKQNNGGISPGHSSQAIEKRKQSQMVEKICKLCGTSFIGTPQSKYCSNPHYKPCPVCGKSVMVTPGAESQPAKCCSIECSNKLRSMTCQNKYGTNIASQSDEVRTQLRLSAVDPLTIAQRKSTSLAHWGVENPSQNTEVRAKISKTVRSKACQNKIQATSKSRYGVPFAMQSPEVLANYSDTIQAKYGVPYYCMTDDCKAAQGNIISQVNRCVGDKLSEMGLKYEFEYRIGSNSYDLHILDTNILLEINPTYTHNSFGNHWNVNGLGGDYHLNKTKTAEGSGYRCIHIFDWDSIDSILNLIKPKSVIYARKCKLVTLSTIEVSEFLETHHLQGTCRGQKVCLGLMYNNQLVQVMTFGTPRYNRKYQWELLRLCSHTNFRVVGGANKLFSHFVKTGYPNSVISYCDRSKFEGTVYSELGFRHIRDTEPQRVWSKGHGKITDNLLRQRGFDQLFNTQYGKGTSNEELMLEHGWLPVYDCGQRVYEWRSDNK